MAQKKNSIGMDRKLTTSHQVNEIYTHLAAQSGHKSRQIKKAEIFAETTMREIEALEKEMDTLEKEGERLKKIEDQKKKEEIPFPPVAASEGVAS